MPTCRDVMTKNPVCCLPGDTVDEAAQIMKRENVGPVPVVENHNNRRLVGIITDRDIVLKVVAEGHDCRSTTVESVMSRDLHTCNQNHDVQKVVDAMAAHQLRRIPVVDDDGAIVGIIAQADIATRIENARQTGDVVEEISQPARNQ